jgi:hypothetical protein
MDNKVKELSDLYYKKCFDLKQLISSVRSYTPGVAFIDSKNGTASRTWNQENFYLFDEVKGFNLFFIRLLKEYQKERIDLNNDIEDYMEKLRSSLNSYDQEVLEFEPMSEYARDMFERDRWNILRPYKDLESLKKEISLDKYTLIIIEEEIQKREENVVKYLSYSLDDLIKEQERIYENLSKLI